MPDSVKTAAQNDPTAVSDYWTLRGKGWSQSDAADAVQPLQAETNQPGSDGDAQAPKRQSSLPGSTTYLSYPGSDTPQTYASEPAAGAASNGVADQQFDAFVAQQQAAGGTGSLADGPMVASSRATPRVFASGDATSSENYIPPALKAAAAALFTPQLDQFKAETAAISLQDQAELNAVFDTTSALNERDFLASHPDYVDNLRMFAGNPLSGGSSIEAGPSFEASHPILSTLAGGAYGDLLLAWHTVNGLVNFAGDTVLQIGDILTGGVNHDSDIIQQAWINQGQRRAGIARLFTSPGAVFSDATSGIGQSYAMANQLDDQGHPFSAAAIRAETGGIAFTALGGSKALLDVGKVGVGLYRDFQAIGDISGNFGLTLDDIGATGKFYVPNPILGTVKIPAGLRFGTGLFGDYMHAQLPNVLAAAYPDATFSFNVAPGITGADAFVLNGADSTGFSIAELKPNTQSGVNSFYNQINRWNYEQPVRLLTYDQYGHFYLGRP